MNLKSPNEQEIIGKSEDPELCNTVLSYTRRMLMDNDIAMTDVQWLSFVSHVSGMVFRSIKKEAIPPIEKEIFSDVSTQAIELANDICRQMKHLHDDEKYLLSIHIESAKYNKN